jgi:hypothetical protein
MVVNQYSPITDSVNIETLSVLKKSNYSLKPFDALTKDFLDQLSRKILRDTKMVSRPEMVALGFWLRKAQINRIENEQSTRQSGESNTFSPLGIVFHVCPANVDTMFMYSMVISLLVGNKNILRISSRLEDPVVLRLFDLLNELMEYEEFCVFKDYINVIKYGHDDEISSFLSRSSNARLIWGGDNTIRTFQGFEKGARTKDIVFADRVSMTIFGSYALLSLDDKEWDNFANLFFNDSYTFDQKGCSSPQTIFFLGDRDSNKDAAHLLQQKMRPYLEMKYENDTASIASLKLNRMVDDSIAGVLESQKGSNLLKIIQLEEGVDYSQLHGCGGGYFYSSYISNIEELKNLSVPKVQTITHYGLNDSQFNDLLQLAYGEGIDRIVKLGNALKFDYIWDGYNLIQELSRTVYYER